MIRTLLFAGAVALAALCTVPSAVAEEPESISVDTEPLKMSVPMFFDEAQNPGTLAICPVTRRLIRIETGTPVARWDGRYAYFASDAARNVFLRSPELYALSDLPESPIVYEEALTESEEEAMPVEPEDAAEPSTPVEPENATDAEDAENEEEQSPEREVQPEPRNDDPELMQNLDDELDPTQKPNPLP